MQTFLNTRLQYLTVIISQPIHIDESLRRYFGSLFTSTTNTVENSSAKRTQNEFCLLSYIFYKFSSHCFRAFIGFIVKC
jgi:hypothetical protein